MTTTFNAEDSSLIKGFISQETKQAMIDDYIASFDNTVMNKDLALRMEKFLIENSDAIEHMRSNLIASMSDFIHVNNFDVEQHECVSRTQIQELITPAVMLTNILNLQLSLIALFHQGDLR